jgi:hypothetical protein
MPVLTAQMRGGPERGQSLVEFALILPVLMALVMGIIEFSLAFNATLGVNAASQKGAHMAAMLGASAGADCLVLQEVDQALGAPNDDRRILVVEVQRTALAGNVVHAKNTWVRSGSTSCRLDAGDSITVPYTQIESAYPPNQRCTVVSGCPAYSPPRPTVDNVGVMVRYRYSWATPLGAVLRLLGGTEADSAGWTFQKRNIFRLEPTL